MKTTREKQLIKVLQNVVGTMDAFEMMSSLPIPLSEKKAFEVAAAQLKEAISDAMPDYNAFLKSEFEKGRKA